MKKKDATPTDTPDQPQAESAAELCRQLEQAENALASFDPADCATLADALAARKELESTVLSLREVATLAVAREKAQRERRRVTRGPEIEAEIAAAQAAISAGLPEAQRQVEELFAPQVLADRCVMVGLGNLALGTKKLFELRLKIVRLRNERDALRRSR